MGGWPTFTFVRLLRNSKSCSLNRKMLYFALDLTTTYNKKVEFRNSLFVVKVGTQAACVGIFDLGLPR